MLVRDCSAHITVHVDHIRRVNTSTNFHTTPGLDWQTCIVRDERICYRHDLRDSNHPAEMAGYYHRSRVDPAAKGAVPFLLTGFDSSFLPLFRDMFEIVEDVPDPNTSFKRWYKLHLRLRCRDEAKGPITAVSGFSGYLVSSMGQKMRVQLTPVSLVLIS